MTISPCPAPRSCCHPSVDHHPTCVGPLTPPPPMSVVASITHPRRLSPAPPTMRWPPLPPMLVVTSIRHQTPTRVNHRHATVRVDVHPHLSQLASTPTHVGDHGHEDDNDHPRPHLPTPAHSHPRPPILAHSRRRVLDPTHIGHNAAKQW